MNSITHSTPAGLDPAERNRLHDLARAQAHALREQALDDFWRGANTALDRGAASVGRSAQRLLYALARRERARSGVNTSRSPEASPSAGAV